MAPDIQELRRQHAYAVRRHPAGIICGVCDRKSRVWHREITSVMAACLVVAIHNTTGPDNLITTAEVAQLMRRWYRATNPVSDWAKLRFWGLIERRGRRWHITDLGVRFARGERLVDRWRLILNNAVIANKGPLVNVQDCLGKRFDLHRLLGNRR